MYWQKRTIYFTIALNALLLGSTPNALAADLTGACCADLEERVATLEATTVRKGNRKISLSLSPAIRDAILANNSSSLPVQLSLLSAEELGKAMQRIAPWTHAPFVNSMIESDKSFSNALMSCPSHGGISAITKEGQCQWFKMTGGLIQQKSNTNNPGFDEKHGGFSGGIQFRLKDNWRLGFGSALDFSNIDVSDDIQHYSTSHGTRFTFGGVLKNQWGALNGYITLSGSRGWYKTKRDIFINNVADIARSNQQNSSIRSNARLTYLMDQGNFYIKPAIDISAHYLHLGGYQETNAGEARLTQSSSSTWRFGLTPSVEIGSSFQYLNGITFRPYLKAGYSFANKTSLDLSTAIGSDLAPFATLTGKHDIDQNSAILEAGLTILTNKDFDLKLNYEATFSSDTASHAGGIKASIKF